MIWGTIKLCLLSAFVLILGHLIKFQGASLSDHTRSLLLKVTDSNYFQSSVNAVQTKSTELLQDISSRKPSQTTQDASSKKEIQKADRMQLEKVLQTTN